MKKLVLVICILFSGCNLPILERDVFIGEWVMSESSPLYSLYKSSRDASYIDDLMISKNDIFYHVTFKDQPKERHLPGNSEYEKKMMEVMCNYQLSPDKRFLINAYDPSNVIMYNDDNKTITTLYGWYRKK